MSGWLCRTAEHKRAWKRRLTSYWRANDDDDSSGVERLLGKRDDVGDIKQEEPSGQGGYAFGPFVVDPVKRTLWREDLLVPITSKTFDVLVVLLEQRGHVVSKDELLNRVWPNTAVNENNLARQISSLRRVLGQRPDQHDFIVTIPGQGYRFVATVQDVPDVPPDLHTGPSALLATGPSTLLGTSRDVNGHGPERRFDVIDGRGDGRGPAERLPDPSIPAVSQDNADAESSTRPNGRWMFLGTIRRGERAPRNGRRRAALAPESDSAASTNPAAHYLCRGDSAPRRGVGARWSVGRICQRPRGQC